jgi:hypothetical protein
VIRRRVAVGAALTGIVVLTASLRIWGWGNWSLWLDEAIQVFRIRGSFREMCSAVIFDGSQPPLDQIILFAVWRFARSDVALRTPAVLYSCATAILLFMRAGGGRRLAPALSAAFSFAALPIAVHYGQEVRPYALGLLLVTAADTARHRFQESRNTRFLGLFVIASLAAVYTIYVAFFPLVILWARDLAAAWLRRREDPGEMRRALAAPAAVVVAFLPWYLTVHARLRQANEIAAPHLTWKFTASFLSGFATGREPIAPSYAALFVFALAALGAWAAGRFQGRQLAVDFLGIFILTGMFLVYTNHWFELRYFYLAVLPFTMLLGEGLAAPRLLPVAVRIPAGSLLAGSLAAALWPALRENAATGRVDWRLPVRYVEAQSVAGRGGQLVPADPWCYFLLSYQSEQRSTPVGVTDIRAALSDLETALREERSGWVARNPGYAGPADLDAFLSASRPWAIFDRADGLRLYRFENGRIVSP